MNRANLFAICSITLLFYTATVSAIGKEGGSDCLLNQLKNSNQDIRQSAADICVKQGVSSVPILIAAIKTKEIIEMVSCGEECAEGWEIADALTQIGIPAIPDLIDALSDDRRAVRTQAATALGNMGPKANSAIPALIVALKDSDSWVRISAANALGKQGSEAKAAVPALIKGLTDKKSNVRTWMAVALGNIGPAAHSAIPSLRQALKDKDANVREFSAEAIKKIKGK